VPRNQRPPVSQDEIWQNGPPLRVSDICAILGWSRPRVHRAIEAGELAAIRPHAIPRATVYLQREEVRRWLLAMGWQRSVAS